MSVRESLERRAPDPQPAVDPRTVAVDGTEWTVEELGLAGGGQGSVPLLELRVRTEGGRSIDILTVGRSLEAVPDLRLSALIRAHSADPED